MTRPTRKRVALIAGGILLLAALVYAFLPDPIPVDAAVAERGPLQVIIEEEGETRLTDRYVVSSPVAAFADRIDLEPGDRVEQGQPLVRLEPASLDPRARNEAAARLRAARAAVQHATVAVERAAADAARMETLFEAGAATRQAMEQAAAEHARAAAALETARAELSAAQAASATGGAVPDVVRAPAAGRVLAVHHESEGPVSPGEPLLEVGDTERLEVRADVLSRDAVRIDSGDRVIIDEWGGDHQLEAVVTRVAPEGFTEISALGVEERRVPVRADLISPPAAWAALGSGYRVLARFIVWESDDVLQVPTSALFRTEEGWGAFVIDDGRAELRAVEVGQQADLRTRILGGLEEGDVVVVHPPNDLEDGARVRVRTASRAGSSR